MVKYVSMMAALRSRFRSERSANLTETDYEATVSRYLQDYVDCGKPGFACLVRGPLKSLGTLIAVWRLPCLHLAPSSAGIEAAAIRAPLLRRSRLARAAGFATAVLKLPHEAGQYSLGASKK